MYPGTHAAWEPDRPAVVMAASGRVLTYGELDDNSARLALALPSSEALVDEIIAFGRDRIAHYKAPRSVDFVDELPRLATGKLAKRVLMNRYQEVTT